MCRYCFQSCSTGTNSPNCLYHQGPSNCIWAISCVRPMKKVTWSHSFRIMGCYLDKDIPKGNSLESTNFNVGCYDWSIRDYPHGSSKSRDDKLSIFLYLKSKAKDVNTQYSFAIVDQSGTAIKSLRTNNRKNFKRKFSCVKPMKKVTRSHNFRIMGYSLDKDIPKGNFLESTIFNVGWYD